MIHKQDNSFNAKQYQEHIQYQASKEEQDKYIKANTIDIQHPRIKRFYKRLKHALKER